MLNPNPDLVTKDAQGRSRLKEGAWAAMTPEERAEWRAWERYRDPVKQAERAEVEQRNREFQRTDPVNWLRRHYGAELWADFNGITPESVWDGVCEVWGLPKREVEVLMLQKVAEKWGSTPDEVRRNLWHSEATNRADYGA